MGIEENQTQVSLDSHSPWKSLRDSHIPTAPATVYLPKTKSKPNPRKETQTRIASLPLSGSFFDENMLLDEHGMFLSQLP
jgi:hypothetical protein